MKPLNTNPVDGQNAANLNDKGCGLCNGTGIADLPDPWGGVRGTCPDCLGGGYDGVTTHPEFGAAPGVPVERIDSFVPRSTCRGDPGECAYNGACMYACGVALPLKEQDHG